MVAFMFFIGLLFIPITLRLARALSLYAVVGECEAQQTSTPPVKMFFLN